MPDPAPQKAPEPVAAKPNPAFEKLEDPTIPVAKLPAAPAAKPKPKPAAQRLPDLPGLGVQDKAAAEHKPMPELPPKFKFADEIVVDRDTRPKSPPKAKQVDSPELPSLKVEDGPPKITQRAPQAEKAPVRPSAAADDIPTLGDSSRVEALAPKSGKSAPDAAMPAPAAEASAYSLAEPDPPANRSDPQVDDPTASFAKVDHDLLDAALASLAVHDDKEESTPESEMLARQDNAPASMPEVTLEKNIESEIPAVTLETDPAVLDQMAAELEKAESLEDVSDKLAETLFGNEELEAISLKIREKVALESMEPLESADALITMPSPGVATASAEPEPPRAPAAPAAPAAAKPAAPKEPAAASPPPAKRGPQPEPIENQFNTSMTATLKTLNSRNKPPSADEDTKEIRAGLLGRLKDTFKG